MRNVGILGILVGVFSACSCTSGTQRAVPSATQLNDRTENSQFSLFLLDGWEYKGFHYFKVVGDGSGAKGDHCPNNFDDIRILKVDSHSRSVKALIDRFRSKYEAIEVIAKGRLDATPSDENYSGSMNVTWDKTYIVHTLGPVTGRTCTPSDAN